MSGIYVRTEEYKRKLSIQMKDIMNRPEVRKKLVVNNAMKRPEVSEKVKGDLNAMKRLENRIKISNSRKGMKFSAEHKRNLSLSHQGERAPNWQGGIGQEPYCFIFGNQEFKEMIKSRDHHTCQHCGITKMLSLKVYNQDLVIHHINYDKKDCDPKNLVTICNSCNTEANYNRPYWQNFYNFIVYQGSLK